MAGSWKNPWLPAFVLAIAAFGGSVALLAAVAYRAESGGTRTAVVGLPGQAQPTATASNEPLTFSGALPQKLDRSKFRPAAAGEAVDIAFEAANADAATANGGVITRYFVPVASLVAGVDTLTSGQWAALVSGTATMKDSGGIGARPQFVAVEADSAVVTAFATAPAETFPTYDALRSAMASASEGPYIALIPLEEMRPAMMAIALDGVDLVRGRGDAQHWPFVERTSVSGISKAGQAAVAAINREMAATLPKATTVVATGDILQSRCTLTAIEATGDWAAALRSPVGTYLKSADLALGSLDGSIQDIHPSIGCVPGSTSLSSPPQVIAALTLAGIDEVTVATNHIFDCGESSCGTQAFLQTLQLLHGADIKTAGGGKNLDEALAPAIFEVGGVKFGVLGFDDIAAEDLEANNDPSKPESQPGTAPMDDSYADEKASLPHEPAFYKPASMLQVTQMQATIRKLKTQVDVVIVQIQSGFEDTHDASPRSIKGLRAAVDAGADLVVGNQGHSVQPVEVRGGSFIAYALGNFIYDQQHTVDETQGYLLEATFWGKKLAAVKFVPYQIAEQYRPEFVTGDTRAKILGDVAAGSANLPAADAVITN